MTEQPDPTRELDLSEIDAESPEESAQRESDIVEGEPGWDDGGEVSETEAPSESGVAESPDVTPPGPAPGGRIGGQQPAT